MPNNNTSDIWCNNNSVNKSNNNNINIALISEIDNDSNNGNDSIVLMSVAGCFNINIVMTVIVIITGIRYGGLSYSF